MLLQSRETRDLDIYSKTRDFFFFFFPAQPRLRKIFALVVLILGSYCFFFFRTVDLGRWQGPPLNSPRFFNCNLPKKNKKKDLRFLNLFAKDILQDNGIGSEF